MGTSLDDVDPDDFVSPEEMMYEYEDYQDFYDESSLSPFNLSQILEHCLEPTVKDGLTHVGKVIVWCVVFRLATQSGAGLSRTAHMCSITTGVIVLAHFFYLNTLYLLVLTLISFLTLLLSHKAFGKARGPLVAFVCVIYNMICELFVALPTDWHQIRGAQMILVMKAVSVAFDMDQAEAAQESESSTSSGQEEEVKGRRGNVRNRRNKFANNQADSSASLSSKPTHDLTEMPSVFAYFGYALCPGTCVFGPWVKYSDYLDIYIQPRWNATWFVKIIFTMAFSLMFLTISTCWNPWLIPDDNWKWWIAYRDAMSFRASHYFVSYVGEASAVAAGFGSTKEGIAVHWNGMQITQPHNIEVPRSLLDVVVSWNIPMHKWLKTYCFKTTINKFGSFVAIFVTYAASTLLHGLNFQLGAVLFSLGFYTYTEHNFRKKLAHSFDASIEAKRGNTGYKHKEGKFLVILVNLMFGLLACFHLAYLGVMFNQQEDIMAEGYSWRHTMAKWEALGFKSHLIMFGTFFLSFLM